MAYDLGVMFKILECVMWSTLMKVLGKNCFVYKCRARDLGNYIILVGGILYAPLYEESSVSDNQPYTIIIQLPKREEKRRNRYYEKYYDRDDAHDREYTGDEHYNDHDEDFGSRAFHIGEKKVQIKVTEDAGSKVHIKVSRIDDDKGIEIADKNNTTVLTTPIFLSSKLLPTHTAETNLLTFKPPLFFQRHIQGI
ncbi:hypothetical protein HZH68_011502 [Vespula germanica]|uniref:Uncharacterized protein n=1 Tax=Vespula germanica TaxID=30212 RepID=A0A834JP87_VESGE|nr:hypothetical protein HZH68_011502 [Vespula germanica]